MESEVQAYAPATVPRATIKVHHHLFFLGVPQFGSLRPPPKAHLEKNKAAATGCKMPWQARYTTRITQKQDIFFRQCRAKEPRRAETFAHEQCHLDRSTPDRHHACVGCRRFIRVKPPRDVKMAAMAWRKENQA